MSTFPTVPDSTDLITLALQVQRQRAVVDKCLHRVPRWRGQLRRELHGHGKPDEIERYVRGYDKLMSEAACASSWRLDSNRLRNIHDTIVGGANFRDTALVVGAHHNFPTPSEVPGLIRTALREASGTHELPVIAAARLHLRILAIHPFADGNGRTARLTASLMLVRHGFRSSLLTAVEQHFHPAPLAYLQVLDQFQYGEITEDDCVAYLLRAMIANSMYATWFRAREWRLRANCAEIGVPLAATDQTLAEYDLDPAPSGYAAELAEHLYRQERQFHMIQATLTTREQRVEFAYQVERLLDEEEDEEVG